MINSLKDLHFYISADLFRYMTSCTFKAFCRAWFIPGFRYTFLLRWCNYLNKKNILFIFYLIFRLILRHYSFKYGFAIHHSTKIGPGLYIGHFGNIVINPNSIIGKNVNITTGVLIGLSYNKDLRKFSYPCIKDYVSLGNNSKIIGGATIGERAFIGVSSVVTKDIPENAVAVGSPAKIISYDGSYAYVGSFHPKTIDYHV